MPSKPIEAYQSVEKATVGGRELEAGVLMRAAAMLAEVRSGWHDPDLDTRLDNALRHNLRIWTLFQTELASADNPLPSEIKQNLLTLASFIDRRTFNVMAYPDPAKLDILIAINKNVAAGLRGEPDVSG
jgi:flagellar protein FlaF